LLQNLQKVLRFRRHQVYSLPDVVLLLQPQLNQVRRVVHAPAIRIHQVVQHLAMLVGRRVRQLILKFCQPVFRKSQKQLDPVVGRLRIADLVSLNRRQVILLRPLRTHRGRAHQTANASRRNQQQSPNPLSPVHGFASTAGGGAFTGSFVRRGNSKLINASSVSIKSFRTSSSGGLTSSGATNSVSETSLIPCRTSNSSWRYPFG